MTTSALAPATYTPVQQRIIDLLGRGSGEAERWPEGFAEAVRAQLEERLAPIAAELPEGETLWVGKSPLATFTQCEQRWRTERDLPFRWTVPAARGTVAHKAIELQVNWRGESEPARLVDEAIARLTDDEHSRIGAFLRTLSTVELAELRGEAAVFVTAFEECFPPIKARWRPVLDGSLRLSLCDGRIVLSGKPDLTLGTPSAGKVIIDFKTGSPAIHHHDDLRFYALLDTLRLGVAPRRVATLYLDSGHPAAETVTTGVIEAAAERVARSIERMHRVGTGEEAPAMRTSGMCRYCPALATCPAGQSWLEEEASVQW